MAQNETEGVPRELINILKLTATVFVLSVLLGVFLALYNDPQEAVPNIAYYLSWPFVFAFSSLSALIAQYAVYAFIGLLVVGAIALLVMFAGGSDGLTELIEKYCQPGPYFAIPAELIPKRDFMAWKETHEDAFNKPSEGTKTSDFWVRDWAKYLKRETAKDAMLLPRPFGFKDELRFRSQFVVGEQGSGKTTYLSHQINADLDRVARGECSVFVMESKNELIPNIARLERFQPGGDLEGKLLYIEPTDELALNIFEHNLHIPGNAQRRARQEALQIISFFLGSVVEMEASSHQETLLKYVIPAVLECPRPTILTLRDILTEEGYARLKPHFAHLRQTEWLDEHLAPKKEKGRTSGAVAITRDALRFRVAGMIADDIFYNLFSRPKSSIDLYDALSEPRVILVNTIKGELGDATAGFGTFFLAKLMQVAQERTLAHGKKLPVFAFIDEATEYLGKNPAVNELINKARSQNISFTFAVQGTEDIGQSVLAALRRCAVQAFNGSGEHGTWELIIEKRPPITVHVRKFSFAHEPHIDLKEYGKLRRSEGINEQDDPTDDPLPEAEPLDNPSALDGEVIPPEKPKPKKPELKLITSDPYAPTED